MVADDQGYNSALVIIYVHLNRAGSSTSSVPQNQDNVNLRTYLTFTCFASNILYNSTWKGMKPLNTFFVAKRFYITIYIQSCVLNLTVSLIYWNREILYNLYFIGIILLVVQLNWRLPSPEKCFNGWKYYFINRHNFRLNLPNKARTRHAWTNRIFIMSI